jgi:mitochondrial fission protein ELM1
LAAMRGRGMARVIVQHPRMAPEKFELVVAARHDRLTGRNVVVTRTALHRVTPQKLAAAAEVWSPRLAHLKRPLVAVLVGGSNGRFRLGPAEGAALAAALAKMMREQGVGVVLTPVVALLANALRPLGAYVHDFSGENPYLGLLALADAIVVTCDSVSMISEAVATAAPVLVYPLPGRSRSNADFLAGLIQDGRIRRFAGRLEVWQAQPLDDTAMAAAEMRRRLGF